MSYSVVIGNVNCALNEVFTKLARLQAKQNFSFAIVAGDLFGDCSKEEDLKQISALLQGNISVPLPTYFTVGSHPIPTRVIEKIESDDEVCPNLYFIGRRGTLKTSEGIRIAALGGEVTSDTGDPKVNNRYYARYTESDARALYGVRNADILITNEWPKSILERSKVPIPEGVTVPHGVECVADICSTLKPRYHFSARGDFFFEREPFFHLQSEDASDAKYLTRFINLASVNNAAKEKWIYAFTFDPDAPLPSTVPAGATASPLASVTRKRPTSTAHDGTFHRFARGDDAHYRPQKRARRPPPGPGECFFCLSNPEIATHLITSIGNDSYVTTAKGPLTTADTYPSLGFPGHMLIIPLVHAPTFTSITEQETRVSTYREMQRYREALHAMLQARAGGKLGAVTWEVSRGNGIHIHWQFLPVSADLITKGLVEAAFKVEAENLSYPKFERSTRPDGENEPGDFFRLWLWQPSRDNVEDGKNLKTLILPLTPDFRFDLQFGRRVMAKLLQLEDRINWRDAVQSTEEETRDAEAFKTAFKEFDFSLEE